MSARYDTTERFFRPADVAALRRNQRRIQVQRALSMAARVLAVALVLIGAVWTVRRSQSDARFAVRQIEITGAVHTPRAAIDAITRPYAGANLFQIDIERLQRDLRALGWVSRIEAEKKLPDTLRIRILERTAVALAQDGGRLHYLDENGVPFAELSPAVGDDDLPLITGARGTELARCVALLRDLRARDPQVFSRLSEVRSVAPDGFALFDRELGAFVYANASDLSSKWRDFYAIAQAEKLHRGQIAYADLRFKDRIVIKPLECDGCAALKAVAPPPHSEKGAFNAED